MRVPETWSFTTISEIANTTSGGTPLRSHTEYFTGDIPWVKSGELRDSIISDAEESISELGLKNSSAKIFPKGTVVVALYGATVGRTGVLGMDATTNQAVCGIFPHNNSFIPKYMFYWLQSQRQHLIKISAGGAQPNISQGIIRSLAFPLAPIPEQERIVAKIESLFTQLDAGVAGLKRAQVTLKRYRASVLKAACEGRLVPQDPNDEPAEELLLQLSKTPLKDNGLKGLPKGWCWVRVGDISKQSQYGTSEKANLDTSGIPVLRMGNIQDGKLDFGNLKYLPAKLPELENLILEDGDLIFNRTNSAELVGKTAIYRKHHPRATFASYLIRVKLQGICLSDYVCIYINSLYGRKYISSVVSQQVGQANVNGTKLANMPLSLPPLLEQRRIVAEVDQRLSVVQEMEQAISANLKRAARLRQAILKRAFEGKLV